MSLAVASATEDRDSTASPAVRRPAPSRYDRAWLLLMTGTDAVLRRVYGVQSFTNHPECLLRIARIASPRQVELGDGTLVRQGDAIAILHFWNEHLPPFAPAGPDLAWALTFRERMLVSLRELTQYLDEHGAWDDVRAIHACVKFGSRRRRWQIQRAAARFGFELLASDVPCGLHEWGEDMLIWALARAFNPAALRRHVLWRDRTELWISRAGLTSRYG
jgi:hypothetical protein